MAKPRIKSLLLFSFLLAITLPGLLGQPPPSEGRMRFRSRRPTTVRPYSPSTGGTLLYYQRNRAKLARITSAPTLIALATPTPFFPAALETQPPLTVTPRPLVERQAPNERSKWESSDGDAKEGGGLTSTSSPTRQEDSSVLNSYFAEVESRSQERSANANTRPFQWTRTSDSIPSTAGRQNVNVRKSQSKVTRVTSTSAGSTHVERSNVTSSSNVVYGTSRVSSSNGTWATNRGDRVHPLSDLALHEPGLVSQRPHPCEQSSCYPATGNLLIGREERLSTSSTCGLTKREKYCIVSHLEDKKKCFPCDSRPEFRTNPLLSHRIENVVYRYAPDSKGRRRTWWQSQNGVENVTIQLDLEAEFHFTHLIATFKTFRPSALLIERSYDFGRTWKVYRYFAYDCDEAFPGVPKGPSRNLTDVVCESRYSNVAPSTEGEVIFRVLQPNLPIDDPYSQEVQNLLKMTNLRINFTKLHTLGDDWLDNREEIREKYYYAIYDMVVRGSCSCYGHASRCLPLPGVESREDMVHGRCECTHNTKGLNCEQCEDFYNDLPWRPAIGRLTNACKRCNCNGHSSSCHFDAAVYEASGKVSGGVCDECQHNTMGKNCEMCKQFFYEEPGRDIQDPAICQPCDCDPRGSLDEGICDSRTDVINGLQAGQCHCKRNVEGRRCDSCKHGFWSFDENNPEGCQSCTCNTLGTVDNQGCHVYSGECTCKRYVVGRDCDQCMAEHYGLSESKDGCKPCECDPGGAYDNQCDLSTGQCKCRPYVTGRACNQPEQGYFAGLLDYRVFEAENARYSDKNQVVIREPFHDGRDLTWTGPGFLKVIEDSYVEFDVGGIVTSTDYDIVVRYEPQLPGRWEDATVSLIREDEVDPNGPCAHSNPQDDIKQATLPSSARHVSVYPPSCLEAGKKYKVRIEFKKYDSRAETPGASVLIDSITLIPRIESLPFFKGSALNDHRRQEFDHYRCSQYFYPVVKTNIPEVCKNYFYSIGFYVLGSGFECTCDPTGSYSTICDSLGGQCQCKTNVVGRSCDQCAPGTFGFGPEGCSACDCNSIGSLDNLCDVQTGQCRCRPNTYGRQCDQCAPGYWNFPNCQRCDCNGHADRCDARTGACLDCAEFTQGHRCDRCLEGFYGDPRLGLDIPCRACPCPGTADSGHSYATRCSLDSRNEDVVCECQEGYAGSRCDICADNYFGNPETPGGICRPCQCNSNIDISRPGNCDARSGECVQCLFNTEGFACEHCRAGYFGNAVNQLCTECVCNLLGTNASLGACDRITGQCPCLTNVESLSCDLCAPNHWKIASGEGCEACDCDHIGSSSSQCNEFDGQCDCREGFGGRKCDQCRANYWGNPADSTCRACECNPEGSATQQCDRVTGICVCLEGIGGVKCDRCARGYVGVAPSCSPCGECFENWDIIINDLRAQTEAVVRSASEIRETGATGAYTREFETMEEKIHDVKLILQNSTLSGQQLLDLGALLDRLREQLTAAGEKLDGLDSSVDGVTQRIFVANLALGGLRDKASDLRNAAQALKDKATVLQEANVEGALNLTREARVRAQKAQDKVEFTQQAVSDSERQRRRTEALLARVAPQLQETQKEQAQTLQGMKEQVEAMEKQIPDLNDQVCDGRGDPCDSLCGGAGCGKCGALSCDDGSVTRSETALGLAREAETHLRARQAEAEEMLRGVRQAEQEGEQGLAWAQQALQAALAARNTSLGTKKDMEDLVSQIEEFLEQAGASPAEIRTLAMEVMGKAISLRPEQITELARQINDTIASLTNIEAILAETQGDLALANRLKERADQAKLDAEGILEIAQQVIEALDAAQAAQEKARVAIDKAEEDILSAERDLTQIASETADAQLKSNESVSEVAVLRDRLKELQRRVLKNERDVKEAGRESATASTLAGKASQDAAELETAYQRASQALDEKSQAGGLARDRAARLQERANRLAANVSSKFLEIREMEEEYSLHEKKMVDLSDEIMALTVRMSDYLAFIGDRSEFYRTCQK